MNPFLANYNLPLVKINKQITFINDEPTGYVGEFVKKTENKSYFVEAQNHLSVYEAPDINEKLFTKMKPNGRDLYLYIQNNLPYNTDTIHLSLEKVNKVLSMSRPTLTSAIQQLLNENIICRGDKQGVYWVNPYYLFKGNRIAYYEQQCPSCIKVVKEINK